MDGLPPGRPAGRGGAIERAALALLCVALVVALAWALRVPQLLAHDESAYALMAREWLGDRFGAAVSFHRAPLLPALGFPVVALGGDAPQLHVIGVLAAVGVLLAVYSLGRILDGPAAGLVAAGVFSFAPPVFRAGTMFLTDLPATAFLVALAALLWSQLGVRPEPDRRLLLAAPLAWAAFELRYGSALPVILLFATSVVVFWPRIRQHVGLVARTLGLLLLLLLPHLVLSTLEMGSPWARVLNTARISSADVLGSGLATYARWFPSELAGPAAAVLMALGVAGAVVQGIRWVVGAGRRRREDRSGHGRRLAFVLVPGAAHVIAIGTTSPADQRFVFFSIALLCVAGALVLTTTLRWLAPGLVPLAPVVLLGLWLVPHVAWLAPNEAGVRAAAWERHELLLVASLELRELGGPECSALTSYAPQVAWYSGCATHGFGSPPVAEQDRVLTEDGWMVLFEDGKRQPRGEALTYYRERFELVRHWDTGRTGTLGSAALYRREGDER